MGAESIVGRIVGILDVNDTKFTAGISKAKTQFGSAHSEITSKGKMISGILGGIGTAMIAVGAIKFLKDAIAGAIEDEVQLVKLKTAVEATGAAWGDYAGRMDAAATAGIALGFMDEKTTEALANLTTMTGDAGKALGSLSLAQDLARATGMDLVAATKLVAKVEEGRIGIASRVLPFLKATMSTEEAIAALREHTAGQAAAYALTAAGAVDKWSASYDRLRDTVGTKVLPVLSVLADAATGLATELATALATTDASDKSVASLWERARDAAADYNDTGKDTISVMDKLSSPFGTLLYNIAMLGGATNKTAEELAKTATTGSTLTSGLIALTDATAGYTEALVYEINNLSLTQTANQRALKDAIAVKAAKKALGEAIKTYGKNSLEAKDAQLSLTAAENKSKDSAAVAKDAITNAGAAANIAAAKYERLTRAVAGANRRLAQTPTAAVRVPGSQVLLAAGGVITRPTSAIVGEAGPEVVVPTTRDANSYGLLATAMKMLGVGGGGGGTSSSVVNNYFEITANVSGDYDVERLAERLQRIQSVRARAIGATA